MANKHAKLRTPVSDVVDTVDEVALEFKNTANRFSNDRRAQVPDVHFLSNIRRREVNSDPLRGFIRELNSILQEIIHLLSNEVVLKRYIKETLRFNDGQGRDEGVFFWVVRFDEFFAHVDCCC